MALTRYRAVRALPPLDRVPAAALRAVWREGYTGADFRADLLAGTVVGVVAIPLAMALAVAVGAPPQHGLYTAIVAGFLTAALGGSRTNVAGPTAAFVVVLAPIHARFGMQGLLLSGLLGGLILVAMGLLRVGRFIEFIPHPVITGFTAGIAVVIAALQIQGLFGLEIAGRPEHFVERVRAMLDARGTVSLHETLIGLGTLVLLLAVPRMTRRVPAPLIVLPVAAGAVILLERFVPGFQVATIGTRFATTVDGAVVAGIPHLPPLPLLPWAAAGPDGTPARLSFDTIRLLMPGAFAVAMLGAIESLLSAVVADGMARTRHDPDAELLALGTANVVTPFFGGIPATGAIARTATNIRSGARSPIAAMTHAVVVLAAVVALAPVLGWLPMASLSALLLLVAWNMSEVRHFGHILRVAPRSDVAVLLTCFTLTVAFDMVIGVAVGLTLAAFMFMNRMAEVTRVRLARTRHPHLRLALPPGVVAYQISGPLFFGAAEKAMRALGTIADRSKAVIFVMNEVHAMDTTGLVAFESALAQLRRRGCGAVLSRVQPQPMRLLRRAGIHRRADVSFAFSPREAVAQAGRLARATA